MFFFVAQSVRWLWIDRKQEATYFNFGLNLFIRSQDIFVTRTALTVLTPTSQYNFWTLKLVVPACDVEVKTALCLRRLV